MNWLKQNQTKSQLGQLLLKKKLISEDQLNAAIDLQKTSGQRLGDILTQLGLVSQRQIQGMLRKQRTIRRMATIVAALLAPVQVYAASVAPVPVTQTETSPTEQKQHGVRELNESELSDVAAQGVLDDVLSDYLNLNGSAHGSANSNLSAQNMLNGSFSNIAKQNAGLQAAVGLVTMMDPLLGLLSMTTTIKDVVYNPASAASVINPDGSITLNLPTSIGEISFQNIRVMGSTGPSLGSIDIKDINLAGTTVTLKAH